MASTSLPVGRRQRRDTPGRQTASDKRWERRAWISPQELKSNINKRFKGEMVVPPRQDALPEGMPPKPDDPPAPQNPASLKRDKDRIPTPTMYVPDAATRTWVLVPRPRVLQLGIFYAYVPLPDKQLALLHWLVDAKRQADDSLPALSLDFLAQHLVPRLQRQRDDVVSLRMLDWFVVDYAQEKGVAYRRYFPNIDATRLVVVHVEYSDTLTVWKRRHFDVFRRRHRIYFDYNGETYSTTVAQLHFFYMADLFGFLDYAQRHAADIETHMKEKLAANAQKKAAAATAGQRYKRRALVTKHTPVGYVVSRDVTVDLAALVEGDDEDAE